MEGTKMKLHQLAVLNSSRVQKYKLPHNDDGSRELARPGQFVHESNESEMVAGFITNVDEDGMTFCLFDARDFKTLPKNAIPIAGELTKEEMVNELAAALELNPDMKPYWVKAVNGETLENHEEAHCPNRRSRSAEQEQSNLSS